MSDSPRLFGQMTRRHWLGHLASTALGVPAIQFFSSAWRPTPESAAAGQPQTSSCSGCREAPAISTSGTSSPTARRTAARLKPIETSTPRSVKISEHMPKVAKQMHHLSIIRSLDSKEGNHERGTYLMHTGLCPQPDGRLTRVQGSVLRAPELGEKLSNLDLPHCVSINTPGRDGAGFLGMSYAPFVVQNPNAPIANLRPPRDVEDWRLKRRLHMLGLVETQFAAQRKAQAAVDHKAVYAKTLRMMNSHQYQNAFNLEPASPRAVRDAYGRGSFGSGCLMARRLVERKGVCPTSRSRLERRWDTHAGTTSTPSRRRLLRRARQGDGVAGRRPRRSRRPARLDHRSVWMGDFGRTPRIETRTPAATTGRGAHGRSSWAAAA